MQEVWQCSTAFYVICNHRTCLLQDLNPISLYTEKLTFIKIKLEAVCTITKYTCTVQTKQCVNLVYLFFFYHILFYSFMNLLLFHNGHTFPIFSCRVKPGYTQNKFCNDQCCVVPFSVISVRHI